MIDKNKVYVSRTFCCQADVLFDWLTDPTLIAQWFGPQGFQVGVVENDLVVDGEYSIELKKEPALSFKVIGKYTKIIKPTSLNFTYGYQGLASPPPPSVVRISLSTVDLETTSLVLVQEFDRPSSDLENRTTAWNFMLGRLNGFLQVAE